MNKNLVMFKGTVNGITIILDADAPFEEIRSQLVEKLVSSEKFFKDAKVNVKFKGRDLDKEEQEILIEIMANQNILGISFIHGLEKKDPLSETSYLDQIKEEILSGQGHLTYFHYGVVRSGQEINYKGSVVVLGDVNPGGVIYADGNVVVIGNLYGKIHAGKNPGNLTPYIMALNLFPTQMGIRNVIAQSPDWALYHTKKKKYDPQIAYLVDEQIYVDEIDFKTLNHMIQ